MLSTPAGTPASSASAHERQRGQRRVLGRLGDHRAAGGQRRRDLARDHRRREVPRRDGGDHADRLLHREHAPARAPARGSRRRWCAWPPRRTTRRSWRAYSTSPRPSASGLPCSREMSRPRSSWCCQDQAFQRLRSCARSLGRRRAPGRERGVRGIDRGARVGRAAVGHLGHALQRGGIGHREQRAGGGRLPAAGDEVGAAQQVAAGELVEASEVLGEKVGRRRARQLTMPRCQGTNSWSPRPSSSLLVGFARGVRAGSARRCARPSAARRPRRRGSAPQLMSMSSSSRRYIGVLLASLMVGAGLEPNIEPRPVVKQIRLAPLAIWPVAATGS